MKTFDQLVNSDAIQAMDCYSQGLMTLAQCVFQLAELDIHVLDVVKQERTIDWKFSSYSDADSISVEDFHAGVIEPTFTYTTEI